MTQPTIDTTQTLLVGIETGLPPKSRQLKQVATQAESKANAQAGTIRASLDYWRWEEASSTTFSKGKNKGKTKTALVKRDGLETLTSFQSSFKAALEHYARFPFATGAKLLPAALAEPFFKTKEQYEKQLPEVWKKWAYDEYPSLAKNAPSRMGAFYDDEDWNQRCSLDACFDAFQFIVTVIPLASADQWQRIALLAPDLAKAQELQTNQAYQKGMADGHAKLWGEVMEPIEHAVTTLSKDGGKIYETLLGNIIKIVDLVPGYNTVFKDQHLANMAAQAKEAFSKFTTEDLRKSDDARVAVLESAKNIVNTFKPYARKLAV